MARFCVNLKERVFPETFLEPFPETLPESFPDLNDSVFDSVLDGIAGPFGCLVCIRCMFETDDPTVPMINICRTAAWKRMFTNK